MWWLAAHRSRRCRKGLERMAVGRREPGINSTKRDVSNWASMMQYEAQMASHRPPTRPNQGGCCGPSSSLDEPQGGGQWHRWSSRGRQPATSVSLVLVAWHNESRTYRLRAWAGQMGSDAALRF